MRRIGNVIIDSVVHQAGWNSWKEKKIGTDHRNFGNLHRDCFGHAMEDPRGSPTYSYQKSSLTYLCNFVNLKKQSRQNYHDFFLLDPISRRSHALVIWIFFFWMRFVRWLTMRVIILQRRPRWEAVPRPLTTGPWVTLSSQLRCSQRRRCTLRSRQTWPSTWWPRCFLSSAKYEKVYVEILTLSL